MTETEKLLTGAGITRVFEGRDKPPLRALTRLCDPEDLAPLLALQQRVYDALSDKDTFVLLSEAELFDSLANDVCIGTFAGETPIAATVVVKNRCSPRGLPYQLGLDQEACLRAVTYDSTFVDPKFTGYGLQRYFMGIKNEIARELGASEAYATVSPQNAVSLQNLLAGGFTIAERRTLYDKHDRYVMHRIL